MPGGQLLQLNVPNAGDGVGLNNQLIPVGRGGADIGLKLLCWKMYLCRGGTGAWTRLYRSAYIFELIKVNHKCVQQNEDKALIIDIDI